jgi:hypothetical protein
MESRIKKHIFISVDTDKAFDKIQHPFMKKALKKIVIRRNVLQHNKAIYDRSVAKSDLY